jgi:hypothetical protein
MGCVLNDHLNSGLFDGSLDDADVNNNGSDVLEDGLETFALDLESLGLEVERLVDEVPIAPDVSKLVSGRGAGSSTTFSK